MTEQELEKIMDRKGRTGKPFALSFSKEAQEELRRAKEMWNALPEQQKAIWRDELAPHLARKRYRVVVVDQLRYRLEED